MRRTASSHSKRFVTRLVAVLSVAVLLALCLGLVGCAKPEAPKQFVSDDFGLFDDAQIARIEQTCKQVYDKNDVVVLVATCERIGDRAMLNGTQLCRRMGYDDGDNVIAFIVNASSPTDNYHYDIYTYGRAVSRVRDNEIDAILDDPAVSGILRDDPASACQGAIAAATLSGKAFGGRIAGVKWWIIIVVALAIGVVIAFVCAGAIKRKYGRNRANDTYALDKNTRLSLKEHEDVYTHSHTTFIILSNNRGGGGGGGHSSGGGGGGGHRGGR